MSTDGSSQRLLYLVILFATLFLALILMFACRNRGVISSGVLFNFWLLLAICGLPEFRYRLSEYFYAFNGPYFNLFDCLYGFVYYILVVYNLILSCFADLLKHQYINVRKMSTTFQNLFTSRYDFFFKKSYYKKMQLHF